MQQDKITKNISELKTVANNSEKIISSLDSVIEKFDLKKNFQIFDVLKSKGFAISSLLSILLILCIFRPILTPDSDLN